MSAAEQRGTRLDPANEGYLTHSTLQPMQSDHPASQMNKAEFMLSAEAEEELQASWLPQQHLSG